MSSSEFRIDSISPALSRQIVGASDLKRRRAAYLLAQMAVAQTELREDASDAAMAAYREGRHKDILLHDDLKKLIEELDDRYFGLIENPDIEKQREALAAFRKARAATALLLALYAEPNELHESIYEAIIALQDRTDAMRSAEMVLSEP